VVPEGADREHPESPVGDGSAPGGDRLPVTILRRPRSGDQEPISERRGERIAGHPARRPADRCRPRGDRHLEVAWQRRQGARARGAAGRPRPPRPSRGARGRRRRPRPGARVAARARAGARRQAAPPRPALARAPCCAAARRPVSAARAAPAAHGVRGGDLAVSSYEALRRRCARIGLPRRARRRRCAGARPTGGRSARPASARRRCARRSRLG
jgi:hypothetical protein